MTDGTAEARAHALLVASGLLGNEPCKGNFCRCYNLATRFMVHDDEVAALKVERDEALTARRKDSEAFSLLRKTERDAYLGDCAEQMRIDNDMQALMEAAEERGNAADAEVKRLRTALRDVLNDQDGSLPMARYDEIEAMSLPVEAPGDVK
jgi:hypothetical protein